jgi:hypothetical protein
LADAIQLYRTLIADLTGCADRPRDLNGALEMLITGRDQVYRSYSSARSENHAIRGSHGRFFNKWLLHRYSFADETREKGHILAGLRYSAIQ